MIISETIPSIVTWADIKEHCRLDEDVEKTYLNNEALACTQQFEIETGLAAGSRTLTVTYSHDDLNGNQGTYSWGTLVLPKGPVISITTVTNTHGQSLTSSDYEIRRKGKIWYLHLWTIIPPPITVVAVVGHSAVPQLIKQAILIHTNHNYLNRGVTSTQQQYKNEMGLDRIYGLYDQSKVAIG